MIKILLSFLSLITAIHHPFAAASSPSGVKANQFPSSNIRLSTHVIPVHYDLLIHPNITTQTFSGFAKIEIMIVHATSSVILHSKYLNITKATIQVKPGMEKEVTVLEYPPFEQIALMAPEQLQTGQNYYISIEYSANLSDNFHGFYKSTYKTPEGKVKMLASTQFEPTSARMAFPCFDEPAFKANFTVKIRRNPKHLALSNMPIAKSVEINEWLIEDHFETSVKMSTYLVAFIVSDFKSLTKTTSRGIKVSVYSSPDKIKQADYALDTAVKLLDFYEGYFGIPYPLPKQDLAALPDFQSGAMENWGLTTYRETSLLYDPEKSSASNKLWVTMVIAHELAHQWFGNLVTMAWWNDLWLNEGFALFMEFVSLSVTHPHLKVEDHFVDKYFTAMSVDALESSHPISHPVENPAQILEMFDGVSYDKGACILNMIQNYLGQDVFKAGVVKYLLKFSYQNTQSEDLWNSLSDVCSESSANENPSQNDGVCTRSQETISSSHWSKSANQDVKTIMKTWTMQKGFPLVTVTVKGKNIHLKQEPYKKGSKMSSSTGNLWHIPLTYITNSSDDIHKILLETETGEFSLPVEVEWIKFNVKMNGYYTVHYGDDGWDSLIHLLHKNHHALGNNDRADLISSVFQMVSAGKLSVTKALDLTLYLRKETEITPALKGLDELNQMYKLLEKRDLTDTKKQLEAYVIKLFGTLIDKQSWDDEGTVSERQLRSSLLTLACVRKYQPCVDKGKEFFTKWKNSNGTLHLPNDIKSAVYAVGIQTDEGWVFLFNKYQLPEFNAEKGRIEFVLSRTQNKEKLQWLMDQGLQGDVIKTQDLPHIIVYIGRNPDGYHLAWNFLKQNWQKLVEKFELGSNSIAHMITGVTDKYSSKEQLAEVKGFFSSLDKESSELRAVHQAIETIEENGQWMDKHLENVKNWLKAKHMGLTNTISEEL